VPEVTVNIKSMADPAVRKDFFKKFNPIKGGEHVSVVEGKDRAKETKSLFQQGLVKRPW
jgi:hypothetical protein